MPLSIIAGILVTIALSTIFSIKQGDSALGFFQRLLFCLSFYGIVEIIIHML